MRRKTVWVGVALLAAVVSYWISRAKVKAQGESWIPFTAVMVQRQYQALPAAPLRMENYTYAVRSDGSWVKDFKRQIMPNGGWGDLRVIADYSSGVRTMVDPSTNSLTSYPFSKQALAKLSVPPPQACSTDPGVQHATVLGYDTEVVKRTLPGTPPGVELVVAEWDAPALDCFPVRQIIDHHSPNASVHIVREALYVSEGAPSEALFDIPTDYVERSPSQVTAERARLFPNEPSSSALSSSTSVLDRVYQSYRKNGH